ncbi:MAG: PucR family transcriptional regulator [Lachnospiraceae bacterium]
MDITAGIIIFQLQQIYDLTTNLSIDQDMAITGFRIWGGEDPEEGILYLCSSQPMEVTQWQKKIHMGINYENTDSNSIYISINGSVDLFQLINSLQEIFQRFYNWRAVMDRLCYQHKAFSMILNELEQTYDLVSILVDKNLKYIDMSDSYRSYNQWIGDTKTMSLDMIYDLMTDLDFQNAIKYDKAFSYYYNDENKTSYCFNIKMNGQYEARILIHHKQGCPFYGGLRFVQYMGEYLTQLLSYSYEERKHGIVLYGFYDIIRDLLHGIPKNADEIQQQLFTRGWKSDHMFQVYFFQFIESENASVTRQYYQVEMENYFASCCVLSVGEDLCCIRNLTMTDSNRWDMRQELSVFLRENLCKAGISRQFDDISRLHNYYLEAKNALMLGTHSQSTWWYYPFEKMVLPYIFQQAAKEMDAHQLYHPAIRTLLEYDQKQHSDMVHTIYEYMKNRYNVTQTAQALFIHRISMLFRLQRIEQLTDIDWDSWNDRVHMAVTFELMKQCGEKF